MKILISCKAISISITLYLISFNAMADWVKIIEKTDEASSAIYVETTTFGWGGGMAQVWTLENYDLPRIHESRKYISVKQFREFGCHDKTYRMNFQNGFDGKMLTGYSQWTNSSVDFEKVEAGSTNEFIMNFACKISKERASRGYSIQSRQ